MPDSRSRRLPLEIALVSFVILFQELALIRWIPSQVRVIAYFPNIVLMSAFLGLGIGCLTSRKPLPQWTWPAAILTLGLTSLGLSRIAFTQESVAEHLWLLYYDLDSPPVINDIRLPILLVFVLSAISFVPLGHYLAVRIAEMTRRGKVLKGYALDLLGSLIGTVAFALFSYFWTPPVAWFAMFLGVGAWLFGNSLRRLGLFGLAGIVLLGAIWMSTREQTFSPYYGISIADDPTGQLSGQVVLTNGSLHQYIAPVASPSDLPSLTEWDRVIQQGYSLPYEMLDEPPGRVLVLGAGTGNDVATALKNGARHVDAVEIDPAIITIGRQIHPNRPYSDPRVRVFNDDARSFLEKTDETYDLIVFGTLDSMTRLSALSSVRLDNFVYTTECLEAAREVMAPDGGIIMYFLAKSKSIDDRLLRLHVDVFGKPPVRIDHFFSLFNIILMSGPAYDHIPQPPVSRSVIEDWKASVEPATDDWPFLYLRGRGFTPFYVQMTLILALIGAVSVFGVSKEMRSSALRGRVDVEMLALGAAFLLLETKSVTEMNLAWGATWLTNAIVFSSILTMLLAATLLMDRWPLTARTSVACLTLTLIVAYLSPVQFLLDKAWPAKFIMSILVVGSPIFFASTLFAVRFKARTYTDIALGWNLLGAVLGGLLEFSSMLIGIRNLALLALTLYLIAQLAGSRFVEPDTRVPEPASAAPA